MNVFPKYSVLVLTNYWILSFSHFSFVSGVLPRCTGEPLSAAEFSKEGDVGFVRDTCVDLIARNLFNKLKCPATRLCEELASTRTSTCFSKSICVKWKRSSFWNAAATNRVMAKAKDLIESFNVADLSSGSLSFDDEKFMFERIAEAQSRIVNSRAATKYSQIFDDLRKMKINFSTRYMLDQNQRVYQEKIGEDDAETMKKIEIVVRKEDLADAIKMYIRKFEAEKGVEITQFFIICNILKTGRFIMNTLPRLRLEFEADEKCQTYTTVFLQIPSLYPLDVEEFKKNIFEREIHFYTELLPELYRLGNCKPFAPKFLGVTEENAFVLEDLTLYEYDIGHQKTLLSWDETRIALDALARYHALGHKYLQTLTEDDERMALIKSNQPALLLRSLYESTLSVFYKIMERSLSKSLHEKISKLHDELLANDFTQKYPSKDSMTVIIHGDYHISNILFKRSGDNKPTEAVIIHWKICRKANPALDLIFFLITSVPTETFERYRDELLDLYLHRFNDMLKSIKIERTYNRSELDQDILYYKSYYLRVLCIDWQLITEAGQRGKDTETELYLLRSLKWLSFFGKNDII